MQYEIIYIELCVHLCYIIVVSYNFFYFLSQLYISVLCNIDITLFIL